MSPNCIVIEEGEPVDADDTSSAAGKSNDHKVQTKICLLVEDDQLLHFKNTKSVMKD